LKGIPNDEPLDDSTESMGVTTAVSTMTAIVHDEYGTAPEDVLRLDEVDKPTIRAGEVLVRVHAASVDRGTWHLMAGLPYPIRVAGSGLGKPKYLNPGRSLAGTVEATGNDVTGFQPGDEVFSIGDGSFAEYARAQTGKLAPKPANLSFDKAAAVPVSALPALQGVRDHGQVQAGQQVLIVGASGGVGTFTVQIAKAFGAEVTSVCSTAKVDLVQTIGADHVVDYTRNDFADGKHQYDVILDIEGTAGCPISGTRSPPREHLSSSEARRMAGGSAAPTVSSGRACCPRSSARNWARSSRRKTPTT
jgi:NADPH:quinone reductase-like Zn-dependent oxidoreductase